MKKLSFFIGLIFFSLFACSEEGSPKDGLSVEAKGNGKLSVKVTNGGNLHDASVKVRLHGDTKPVISGRTYTDKKSNPMKKELAPGVYDIVLSSINIKGATANAIIGKVHVKANETTAVSHDFPSAELSIGALFNGELEDATVNIISVFRGMAVAEGKTTTKAAGNPEKFTLSPGEYVVTVKGIKGDDTPEETFKITLKAGDEVEKMVKW